MEKPGEGDGEGEGPARHDWARLGALAVFVCALASALLPLTLSAVGAIGAMGAESGRPAWVERFPNDPDAYAGIGRADKRAHPHDYRDVARDAALAQISREISVDVVSSAVSARREDAAGREEAFSARTRTFSRNALAGYRLEGVHETPEAFWAYYALDKAGFRAARDAEERRLAAWMESEAASLSEDLQARRLQAAADRHARILAALGRESEEGPLPKGRASPSTAWDTVSARFAASMAGLRLECVPARWESNAFPGAEARTSAPGPSLPRVSLTDRAGGPWQGPFSLILSHRARPDAVSCRVETDGEGRWDPGRAFRECGMEPGLWTVTWAGRPGEAARTGMAATLRKRDLGLTVLASAAVSANSACSAGLCDPADSVPGAMAARAAAGLSRALVGTQGHFHRIVGGNAHPVLELRLREAALDSLDGLYFATLRADALFPGASAPVAVRGKGGHADQARAWVRAQEDLAKALNAWTP